MLSKQSRIVIIGGGMAGLTTSWFLQRDGYSKVTILEKSSNTTMEASGLNSGLIRHYHPLPHMRRDLTRGISLLRSYQEERKTDFYEESPSLWLIRPDVYRDLEEESDLGVEWETVPGDQVPSVFQPNGNFERIWLTFKRDGLLDSVALGDQLKKEVEHSSVTVRTGVELVSGQREDDQWRLELQSGEEITADRIVNAAGVWANIVGERLGLDPQPFDPVSRHLFYLKNSIVPSDYSYFMDHHNRFFLRRTEEGTLVSYCDELPTEPGETDQKEYPEDHLDNVIGGSYSNLDLTEVEQHWSGQYAMTSDRKPIIDPDPDYSSVIWATGLNDFGMGYAFRIGERVAELVESYGT